MFFDSTFLILVPAVLLALYAQFKVTSAYNKYAKINTSSGITGGALARNLLDKNGLGDVPVRQTTGHLTDNYDPTDKSVNLSGEVYSNSSIAAASIAAHETGHAVQNKVGYFPLKIRSAIVPVSSFGSNLAFPLFFVGLLFGSGFLMDLGIWLFALAVAFTVIVLPVEFNASKRAAVMLSESGYMSQKEVDGATEVLNAAALTYVAATATAMLQLIRLLALRKQR